MEKEIKVPNTNLPQDQGNIESGQIYLSNESRFDNAHFSQPLTTFATGWKDQDDLVNLLDFIAPAVNVSRRFEFKKADSSDTFLSEEDDIRASGSSFKRIEYSGSTVNAKTLNKGLTMRVDHDDTSGENWTEHYVQLLIQRLYRNEIKRAVTALQSINEKPIIQSWANGNPDALLLEEIIKSGNESGLEPNRALFGRSAWQIRHKNFASNNNAGAFAGLMMNPEQVASMVGLDGIRVSKERIHNNTSGKKDLLLTDSVILFHGQNIIGKDDASTLKRFVTPIGGQPYRVYIQRSHKYTDITVEHYSNIITTSTLGVKAINVSTK